MRSILCVAAVLLSFSWSSGLFANDSDSQDRLPQPNTVFAAIYTGHLDEVKKVLEIAPSSNQLQAFKDIFGHNRVFIAQSALDYAIARIISHDIDENTGVAMMQLLLDHDADPNVGLVDIYEGQCRFVSLLEHAIQFNAPKAVLLTLLASPYIQINVRNQRGETPLWRIVDNFLTYSTLDDSGEDFFTGSSFNNNSSSSYYIDDEQLSIYFYSIRKPLARLLLSAGADINARNNEGKTILHKLAASYRDSAKSPSDHTSLNRTTPFPLCPPQIIIDALQFLIDNGADINTHDDDGHTPLQDAQSPTIVAFLCAHGAIQ